MSVDIKIFVCHDKNHKSLFLNNPLYNNILAGSDFVNKNDYKNYIKDNTGDNISSKNKFYNELTVQYWMWKNVDADYYGLCHYRRYISFSKKRYKISLGEHNLGLVTIPALFDKYIDEHNLNNQELIAEEISKNDLICMEPISVKKYFPQKNMYLTYAKMPLWHNIKDIDSALDAIKKIYPSMYDSAKYYFFKSKKCYYYNCWIMKKDLFKQFSKFLFDILFEVEKKIDYTHYSNQLARALGLIGERLFGVFLTYIERQNKYKICHRQVLFIENTSEHPKLLPFSSKKNIPIVTICNDFYVPYFSALLASLLVHCNANNHYDFVVIEKDISDNNKKLLLKMIAKVKNISLRFYNPLYELNETKFYMNSNTVTENTYYRLLTPWILSNYKKAIVIDSDLVFNEDPAKLFETDIAGYYIAAAKDAVFDSWVNGMNPEIKKYAYDYMNLKNPYNYVNTGVMVMNVERIRQSFSLKEFINLNTTKPYKVREQDSMNVIFENNVKFIPIKWNFYIEVNDFIKKCIINSPTDVYEEYKKAEANPYILHWASYPKPWVNPYINYSEIWWKYSKMTPFYEICILRLAQNRSFYSPSFIRKLANKLAPPFTKRREFLKKLLWKSSGKRNILGKLFQKIAR